MKGLDLAPAGVMDGLGWLRDPYRVLERHRRRHGLTFRLRLPTLGRPLVTGDPSLLRDIVHHPDLDSGRGVVALRGVLGDRSLITLDGDEHRRRHRLLAGHFREREVAVFDDLTRCLARRELEHLHPGEPFSAYRLARRIFLAVILRVLFGELTEEEARHGRALAEGFLDAVGSPWSLFLRPLRLPATPWARAMARRRELLAFLVRRLEACQRLLPTDPRAGGLVRRLQDDAVDLSDETRQAEILALLLFGHDTGAAALAWALAHLCARPQLLERIRCETPPYPFLQACLQESLRLAPVVPHLTRVARRELTLGGHRLAAGERVFPCAYLAHRNPESFPHPERFEPERFLHRQPSPYAYFPFGLGERTCIGKPFALRQLGLVAHTLISAYDLTLAPGYRPEARRHQLLVLPSEGALLTRGGVASPSGVSYREVPA